MNTDHWVSKKYLYRLLWINLHYDIMRKKIIPSVERNKVANMSLDITGMTENSIFARVINETSLRSQ